VLLLLLLLLLLMLLLMLMHSLRQLCRLRCIVVVRLRGWTRLLHLLHLMLSSRLLQGVMG
jgi:hypothetical protein